MLLTAATVPVVRLVTTGDNFEEERIVFEQAIHEDFNSFLPKHIIKTVMFRSGTISECMPIYLIERINTSTGKAFNDGEHIIYINGAYLLRDQYFMHPLPQSVKPMRTFYDPVGKRIAADLGTKLLQIFRLSCKGHTNLIFLLHYICDI